ncbi:MAG TPA: carboxypeptidase-like regulatory domain-containing protein [Chloroflexota bacterium]|nr:carboxypeptidase-like regulatory domain-containing protein [Chloroflexota bacterium]
MTASAPGYSSGSQQARVSSGAITTVEIRLQPLPGSLTGKVTHALSGAPVAGATVALGQWSTQTDAGGRYHLFGLLPGAYTLQVSLEGYGTHRSPIAIGPGASQTLDLTLTPLPGTLRVRVVDATTGNPIQGAAVSYGTAASTAAGDEQPCADYALLVPLKRSREYRVIRSRVVDPRPADAWQQDGLHLFVFELRPIDAAGTAPPDPPVAVFAMRPEPGELVSAVVVTPRRFEEPEVTPVQVQTESAAPPQS